MARNCPIFLNCLLRKIKAFISGQPSRKVACGIFFDTLLARPLRPSPQPHGRLLACHERRHGSWTVCERSPSALATNPPGAHGAAGAAHLQVPWVTYAASNFAG